MESIQTLKCHYHFLNNGASRQQLLLDYFAEADAPACGVCDVCLARKKAQQAPADATTLHAGLLETLKAAPYSPRELVARYPPAEAPTVTAALRTLVEAGKLAYATDGKLRATA